MSEKWPRIPPFLAPSHFPHSPAQLLLKIYSRLEVRSLISVTQHSPASSASLIISPLSPSCPISFLSYYKCDVIYNYKFLNFLPLFRQFPQRLWLTPRLTSISRPHSLCLIFSLPHPPNSNASKRILIQIQARSPISFQWQSVLCDFSGVSELFWFQGTESACLL